MIIDPRFQRIVLAQPYPLLFTTINGAVFGFPFVGLRLRSATHMCRSTQSSGEGKLTIQTFFQKSASLEIE